MSLVGIVLRMLPSTFRIEVDWAQSVKQSFFITPRTQRGHRACHLRPVSAAALLDLLLSAIHSASELGVVAGCVPNIVELAHLEFCRWLVNAKR